jgi:hypothetical protein
MNKQIASGASRPPTESNGGNRNDFNLIFC